MNSNLDIVLSITLLPLMMMARFILLVEAEAIIPKQIMGMFFLCLEDDETVMQFRYCLGPESPCL